MGRVEEVALLGSSDQRINEILANAGAQFMAESSVSHPRKQPINFMCDYVGG